MQKDCKHSEYLSLHMYLLHSCIQAVCVRRGMCGGVYGSFNLICLLKAHPLSQFYQYS